SVTGGLLRGAIDPGEAALEIVRVDDLRGVVEELPIALLARLEHRFGAKTLPRLDGQGDQVGQVARKPFLVVRPRSAAPALLKARRAGPAPDWPGRLEDRCHPRVADMGAGRSRGGGWRQVVALHQRLAVEPAQVFRVVAQLDHRPRRMLPARAVV